jgi:TRAP-type C4-dicarboxylate transport system permease small subunit
VIGVKGHLAPALQIPMEIPYSACIVGSMLMLFYVLKTFIKDINSKNPME